VKAEVTRRGRKVLQAPRTFPVLLTFALWACGSPEPTTEHQVSGTGIPALPAQNVVSRDWPAGTAKVLSLSAGGAPGDQNPYERATGCVIAMKTLATALQDMPALAGETEQAALRKAEAIYEQRANEEAAKQGLAGQVARSEMEQRLQAALDEPAPQMRRASACLRALAAS